MLDEREERERRDLRRRERERKRLELGDHYVSDDDSQEDIFESSGEGSYGQSEEASDSVSPINLTLLAVRRRVQRRR
jgi:hypothetical protein